MRLTRTTGGFRALTALAIFSNGAIAAALPATSAFADAPDRGRDRDNGHDRSRDRDRGRDRDWDRDDDHRRGRVIIRHDDRGRPSYAEIEFANGQRDGLRAGYDRGYADGLRGRDLHAVCGLDSGRLSRHYVAGYHGGFDNGYRAGYLAGKRECERLRELERQRERERDRLRRERDRRDRCDPPGRGGFRIIDGLRIHWRIRL